MEAGDARENALERINGYNAFLFQRLVNGDKGFL